MMKRSIQTLIPGFFFILLLAACSPRIYRPPALGAEYRFDEGLKPAKHPSRLFDKGMNKYLEEHGIREKPSSARSSHTAKQGADSTVHTGVAADPAHTDTLTTPAPATSPGWPDSSHNGLH